MPKSAIVDYEICNMFSVKRALEFSGFESTITQDSRVILDADVVILPGVGAFAEAMKSLKRLDLISPLLDVAASGKPMIGICLGFQMLFSISYEFAETKGLNLIPGIVRKFENEGNDRTFKIPHIGWNRVDYPVSSQPNAESNHLWRGTPMEGTDSGSYFYFVHSFYAIPHNSHAILAETSYGPYRFCSACRWKNVYGFQFHPERSGRAGIAIYENIKKIIRSQKLSHV